MVHEGSPYTLGRRRAGFTWERLDGYPPCTLYTWIRKSWIYPDMMHVGFDEWSIGHHALMPNGLESPDTVGVDKWLLWMEKTLIQSTILWYCGRDLDERSCKHLEEGLWLSEREMSF